VIGVFPEGTSYTLPSIIQVLPGAAWAAVEYVRQARRDKLEGMKSGKERLVYLKGVGRHGEMTGLEIVPVGIVYEDKKQFMSRVSGFCRFNVEILMRSFCAYG
jgi:glycerol-3-phosphate O-acyltransferase/dihydroxyacetone phosphate acyltransferase